MLGKTRHMMTDECVASTCCGWSSSLYVQRLWRLSRSTMVTLGYVISWPQAGTGHVSGLHKLEQRFVCALHACNL